ncbi:MAG: class I SAM-dependent methyltransferase, partial [Candidatus Acidiferrum sp.]
MGLARVLLYVRSYTGIQDLNRRTASLFDRPADLIAATQNYGDGFLGPVQVVSELARLLDDVKALHPQTVVEIGTHRGGTLYLWTRFAQSTATLISIDLPRGKFGGGYSPFRIPIYRRFARHHQKLHLLRADSHAPSTLEETKRLLANRPIDLLFIDGDHTYDGVKQDWQLYSPLVRPAGLIVFHDIAGAYADTNVKTFWDSIKLQHSH